MPEPNASHDQKSHFHLIFNILTKQKAVVPVMMPLVSHDADPGTSGITWPKKLLHFLLIVVI